MDKSKRLIRTHGRAFTMVEIIVVVVVASILLSIITPTYMHWAERARAAEVYATFKQFRESFLAKRAEGKCLDAACGWVPGPQIPVASNYRWQEMYMENPNADPRAYFSYAYWDTSQSNNPPVNDNTKRVIIAFRRRVYVAYADGANLDTNKYIFMDLETGEITKSYPY